MRIILGVVAAAVLVLPVLSFAETLQTYYPSPTGIYNTVTVTSNTVLGRNGGIVTVGSKDNPNRLVVNGSVKLGGTEMAVVCGTANEGEIRYNQSIKNLQFCDGDSWRTAGNALPLDLEIETKVAAGNCDTVITVYCSSGKRVLGGGIFAGAIGGSGGIYVRRSCPTSANDGWVGLSDCTGPALSVNVYAICARVK